MPQNNKTWFKTLKLGLMDIWKLYLVLWFVLLFSAGGGCVHATTEFEQA
jgi:hypothetical protein